MSEEKPFRKTDASLTEEIGRALWEDQVLSDVDYDNINVRVKNGIAFLTGHVISSANRWRAEKAVENIQGILGVRNHLIPDDSLLAEVAKALAPIEAEDGRKLFLKAKNGLVILSGEMSSLARRSQAEKCVADIPWVRGVFNEIRVAGAVPDTGDQRFLQPPIGKEIYFHGGFSVTVRQVVINPHNRRVVSIIVLRKFSDLQRGLKPLSESEKSLPEQLMVIPVSAIQNLTRNTGSLRINDTDTNQLMYYEPSQYVAPAQDWLPPYPYRRGEVLFLLENRGTPDD